jgi:hypothetical protein
MSLQSFKIFFPRLSKCIRTASLTFLGTSNLAVLVACAARFWELLTVVGHREEEFCTHGALRDLTLKGWHIPKEWLLLPQLMSFLIHGHEAGTVVQKAVYLIIDIMCSEIRTLIQQYHSMLTAHYVKSYLMYTTLPKSVFVPPSGRMDVSYNDRFH